MNFEEIQKSWKAQPLNDSKDPSTMKALFEDKWQINKKALLKTNLLMSFGFLLAMAGIVWVYLEYHQHFHWPFDLSIAACCTLMILFAAVCWRSYGFKKDNLEGTISAHLQYQLQKLRWQRLVLSVFTLVYTVLLWIALMMYTFEVTARGTLIFQIEAIAVITLYMALVSWLTRKRKQRTLAEINAMIAELETIQLNIEGEN
jgi:hypothetical protein